jgi:hypothetical protein
LYVSASGIPLPTYATPAVAEIRDIPPKSANNIKNVTIAKRRKHRNTSSGGAKRRAPPKAGLLVVSRLFKCSRFCVLFCFRNSADFA